ncbi:hypothetical protein L1887_05051 [Cichorium endivia]|nr:hypothetical protein L1887_05051 [Cichorium endivia]
MASTSSRLPWDSYYGFTSPVYSLHLEHLSFNDFCSRKYGKYAIYGMRSETRRGDSKILEGGSKILEGGLEKANKAVIEESNEVDQVQDCVRIYYDSFRILGSLRYIETNIKGKRSWEFSLQYNKRGYSGKNTSSNDTLVVYYERIMQVGVNIAGIKEGVVDAGQKPKYSIQVEKVLDKRVNTGKTITASSGVSKGKTKVVDKSNTKKRKDAEKPSNKALIKEKSDMGNEGNPPVKRRKRTIPLVMIGHLLACGAQSRKIMPPGEMKSLLNTDSSRIGKYTSMRIKTNFHSAPHLQEIGAATISNGGLQGWNAAGGGPVQMLLATA